MLLIAHIIVALATLAYSAYLVVSPSRAKLKISYGLTALTVVSGTYLGFATHSKILSVCLFGLVFIGVSLVTTAVVNLRLSVDKN